MNQKKEKTLNQKNGINMQNKSIIATTFAISILLFLSLSGNSIAAGLGSSSGNLCTSSITNFKVLNVQWGNLTSRNNNISTLHISAGPGMKDVPLTVTLEYYFGGCSNLQSVVGTLSAGYSGITGFDGTSQPSAFVSSVQLYQSFNMVFYLNMANNISSGHNVSLSYPLFLSWYYPNTTINGTQEVQINIPFKGTANLTYSLHNLSIPTGETDNITLNVRNTGTGDLSDVNTRLSASSGISILSQPQIISKLDAGNSKNLTFSVYVPPSTSGQPVTFDFQTSYINPYGYNMSVQTSLGAYTAPSASSDVSISASTDKMFTSSTETVNMSVWNNGGSPLYNVTLSLSPSSPLSILETDGVYYAPVINPGKNVSFPVTFYVATSSSNVASISASLSYITGGREQSSSRSLNFLLPVKINITDVSYTTLPSSPVSGSIFSLTSTLENTGSGNVNSVAATPLLPKGFSVIGSNTTFIGDMAVDTPTPYTISFITSPSTKSGKYVIPVVITYLNNLNQKGNVTLYYNVSIGSSSLNYTPGAAGRYYKNSTPWFLIILAIIIIVIAAGIYFARRKRKKISKSKAKV